jgi:CRISPR/Cas system-associated exonuclease Cas4 (RecB family)
MLSSQTVTGFDPDKFIQMYEQTYKDSSNRSGFKTKKTFAPSKLGYKYSEGVCPRYWYIAFSGAEFIENIDTVAQANMDNGSYSHTRIQSTIEKMGILHKMEQEITNEDPPIRGFVDLMIDWEGEIVPGEIKTANADSFTFRVAQGKPSGSHYVQFIVYLKVLGKKEGFILYENKDNQSLAIIKVKMGPKQEKDIEYLFEWMRNTRKAFDEKTLPEIPKAFQRKNARICRTCPVRNDCFDPEKFGEGEVVLPVLEVPTP